MSYAKMSELFIRTLREDPALSGEAERVFRAADEAFAKQYGGPALN